MTKRATYDFDSRVVFHGFSGDGKRLLVLTSDYVVYVLNLGGTENASAARR